MPNRYNENIVEVWRSRLTGRDTVYFRHITHTGDDVPPDSSSSHEVAELLWAAREKYGKPRISHYDRGHGRITRYVWRKVRGKRFTFCPSSFEFGSRRRKSETYHYLDASFGLYWED